MGPVGLIIYPSEDFDFVNLVQLPDLILDLFCIHFNILVMVDMVIIYYQSLLSILFLVLGPPCACGARAGVSPSGLH
jgi:hypothetical protein